MEAGYYYSLIVTEVPDCFEVTVITSHGEMELMMEICYRGHPIEFCFLDALNIMLKRALVERQTRGI